MAVGYIVKHEVQRKLTYGEIKVLTYQVHCSIYQGPCLPFPLSASKIISKDYNALEECKLR